MRSRTRVIAAAAVTAALAAGTTGAALASTAGGHAKTGSATGKRAAESDLAARLGVSQPRLDRALGEVKISLSKGSAKPTPGQFDATLARILGIPQARVRQALPAGRPGGSKAAGSQARVSAALRPLFAAGRADSSSPAFAAAARSLGVSVQQLSVALEHAKQSLAGGT